MNNVVFEEKKKKKENVRKQRDIKLITTKSRQNYLVSEPIFFQKFISHRNEKNMDTHE